MVSKQIKQGVKRIFKKAGLEVRRLPGKSRNSNNKKLDPPPLFDDPFASLAYEQVGGRAVFRCPLNRTIKLNALSYSPGKWHAFVEALREYEQGSITTYEGSALEAYYICRLI